MQRFFHRPSERMPAVLMLAMLLGLVFQIWLAPDDVKAEMVRLRQGGVK